MVPPASPSVGHLRVRSGHGGREKLPLLRGPGQLSVRAWSRSRGDARRRWSRPPGPRARCRDEGGHRAGARLCPSGYPSPVSPVRQGPHRAVRQRRLRRPRTGPADRVLRRHRRRMVDRRAHRPPRPAPRRAGDLLGRGRRDRRAGGLCRPCRPVSEGGARRPGGHGGSGDARARHRGRPPPSGPALRTVHGGRGSEAPTPAARRRRPRGRLRRPLRAAVPGHPSKGRFPRRRWAA